MCTSRTKHDGALLTLTTVGGASTGVEFAGALAELLRGPMVKDYSELDFRVVGVMLFEAQDSLLPGLPASRNVWIPVAWLGVHLLNLIGVRNRLFLM